MPWRGCHRSAFGLIRTSALLPEVSDLLCLIGGKPSLSQCRSSSEVTIVLVYEKYMEYLIFISFTYIADGASKTMPDTCGPDDAHLP